MAFYLHRTGVVLSLWYGTSIKGLIGICFMERSGPDGGAEE